MTVALYTHPDMLDHRPGDRHPERPEGLRAGVDAHVRDPPGGGGGGGGGQSLEAEDFAWAARVIVSGANRNAKGRVVSSLEGGYDLEALGSSALARVRALSEV